MISKTVEELLCFATSGMDEDEQALVQQQFSDSTNRGEMIDTEMRVVNDGVSQWL